MLCVLCTLCLCCAYVLRDTLSLYPPLNCAKELTQRWGLTKDLLALNFHFHKHTHARSHTHSHTHTHGTATCLDNSLYLGKVVCCSALRTLDMPGGVRLVFCYFIVLILLFLFNAHATRSWDYEKRCCTVGLSDLFVVVQERAHERQNDTRCRYDIRKISISIKFHLFFILPALVVAAVAAPPVVVATTATWSQ